MVACPFGVPTFEWDKLVPFIRKCTFCAERTAANEAPSALNGEDVDSESASRHVAGQMQPVCAKTCPTGAIKFGERDDLLKEARARIEGSPGRYVDHIFGEKEAGGTSWLYLASVPFSEIGFPKNLGERP